MQFSSFAKNAANLRRLRSVFFALAVVVVAGCATAGAPLTSSRYEQARDPHEKLNRDIYKFNNTVSDIFLDPLSAVYTTVFPGFIRDRIKSFLDNLDDPYTFINDVLQGNGKRASDTLGRFVLNSTVGIGGLFDPAQRLGIEPHKEDLGQTMAVAGVASGDYLMIPFYGPTTTRDGFGLIVHLFADPVNWVLKLNDLGYLRWPRRGLSGLDSYARNKAFLKDLENKSLDSYAKLRTYYLQNRAFEIRNGKPASEKSINDQFDEFETDSK